MAKEPQKPNSSSAFRRGLGKLIHPPKAIVALSAPGILLLMGWVFLLGNEDTPVAIGTYVLSAYLLLVLCIYVIKQPIAQSLRGFADRHERVQRVVNDKHLRLQASTILALVIDVAWVVGNLVLGLLEASIWYVTLGCYYLVLSLMRLFVFRLARLQAAMNGDDEGAEMTAERTQQHTEFLCGVLMLVSIFVLSGVVTLVMRGEGSVYYAGWTIYAIATYVFYCVIRSLVDIVRYRGHHDRLLILNSRIGLAIGLVSMFSLEIAMFAAFATEADAQLVFVMPIITGTAIALCIAVMGVLCIRDSTRK